MSAPRRSAAVPPSSTETTSHGLGCGQERERVVDGPGRADAAVPGHHDPPGLKPLRPRQDRHDRPPAAEQDRLDDAAVEGGRDGLRIEDREVVHARLGCESADEFRIGEFARLGGADHARGLSLAARPLRRGRRERGEAPVLGRHELSGKVRHEGIGEDHLDGRGLQGQVRARLLRERQRVGQGGEALLLADLVRDSDQHISHVHRHGRPPRTGRPPAAVAPRSPPGSGGRHRRAQAAP